MRGRKSLDGADNSINSIITQIDDLLGKLEVFVDNRSYEDAIEISNSILASVEAASKLTSNPEARDILRLEHIFQRHSELIGRLGSELHLAKAETRKRHKAINAYARL